MHITSRTKTDSWTTAVTRRKAVTKHWGKHLENHNLKDTYFLARQVNTAAAISLGRPSISLDNFPSEYKHLVKVAVTRIL